jgi:membrane-associated phospholipid phosphatase
MQSYRSVFLDFLQNIFSLFSGTIVTGILLTLLVCFVKERIKTIVHIIFLTSSLYYMSILKQVYQGERPFWTSSQIMQIDWFCHLSFGNPSGHSLTVLVLYEPILTDVIGRGPGYIGLVFWLIISSLVMWSRQYLGSHSLDQVLFGATMGISFLVYYRYFGRNFLYKMVIHILTKKHKKFYIIMAVVLWLVFLLWPIAIYLISTNIGKSIDSILLSNIDIRCNKSVSYDFLLA